MSEHSRIKPPVQVLEEWVATYFELHQRAKEIEEQMKEMKQVFHTYLDDVLGHDGKGEYLIGDYVLQRQIRSSESWDEIKTVQVLEELQLTDCIQTVKRPDPDKLEAAITLGLLNKADVEDCLNRRSSRAIIVKKVK